MNNRQFQAPVWYTPAGGGVWGSDGAGAGIFTNGWPSQDSILEAMGTA